MENQIDCTMTLVKPDGRYMEFKIADQLYAIPLLAVKEVIRKPETTPLPNMPTEFEGMMNLRGSVLAVFNVEKNLGSSRQGSTVKNGKVVMVIEGEQLIAGFLVDEVTRVLNPKPDMIKTPPLQNEMNKNWITCIIQTEKALVAVLDVRQLLNLNKNSTPPKIPTSKLA